jgi:hypothetical protein
VGTYRPRHGGLLLDPSPGGQEDDAVLRCMVQYQKLASSTLLPECYRNDSTHATFPDSQGGAHHYTICTVARDRRNQLPRSAGFDRSAVDVSATDSELQYVQ